MEPGLIFLLSYLAGFFITPIISSRVWRKWEVRNGKAYGVRDKGGYPILGMEFWFWPLVLIVAIGFMLKNISDKLENNDNHRFNRLVYGKPPKNLREIAKKQKLHMLDKVVDE